MQQETFLWPLVFHLTRDPSAEGKRIAEHLLSVFGSSDDAFRDASDCLASATLWLHSLKPPARDPGYTGPQGGAGPGYTGPQGVPGPGYAGTQGGLGPGAAGENGQALGQSQPQAHGPGQGQGHGQGGDYGGRPGVPQGGRAYEPLQPVQAVHYPPMPPHVVGMPGAHPVAVPGGHAVVYHGGVQVGMPGGTVMVAPAPPTPAHHPGQPPASMARANRPAGVRFEDYANRPSDYLKVSSHAGKDLNPNPYTPHPQPHTVGTTSEP